MAKVMERMLRDLWKHNQGAIVDRRRDLERHIKLLQQEQEKLLDRIVETDIASVASAYEKRIAQCQRKQVVCQEKLSALGKDSTNFDEMFEHTLEVLSRPCEIWEKKSHEWRIAVLKVVFSEKLKYRLDSGFRTPETTLPFKVLRGDKSAKDNLPDRADFEPCWPLLSETFGGNPPAATMIECGLIDPRYCIEIEVTALAP